jgi:hypothetical protein
VLKRHAELLRTLLVACCRQVDDAWCALGQLSGCTVTLLLVTGPLLTAANLGDSLAFLDDGAAVTPLAVSHRIQVRGQCDWGGGGGGGGGGRDYRGGGWAGAGGQAS